MHLRYITQIVCVLKHPWKVHSLNTFILFFFFSLDSERESQVLAQYNFGMVTNCLFAPALEKQVRLCKIHVPLPPWKQMWNTKLHCKSNYLPRESNQKLILWEIILSYFMCYLAYRKYCLYPEKNYDMWFPLCTVYTFIVSFSFYLLKEKALHAGSIDRRVHLQTVFCWLVELQ